ncbi:hypothetical protein F4778DRAFT_783942 [Xylariomycetidae sp. FL2044]|nr:hypothetical protein F4778DRAFT_783942 [Xylariomycetidae sp. FL2044]
MEDPADAGARVPISRINLSQPPRQLYGELAIDFSPGLQGLTSLFDNLLLAKVQNEWLRKTWMAKFAKVLAKTFVRHVFDDEENEEILGTTKAAGLCTSGTLDWPMRELCDFLVVLNYVNTSAEHPNRPIAPSVTNDGFVGSSHWSSVRRLADSQS